MIRDDSVIRLTRLENHRGDGGSMPASSLWVHFDKRYEADALVKRFHYSRRIPSNVQQVATMHTEGGLFGDAGPCVAACYFSIPPTQWSEPVWELSRLVRAHDRVPLSFLISKAIKKVQRCIDLIVSFADETHAHTGYVYRACSWNYGGLRERRMDGLIVDGEFVPGRSCNARWGTRSPTRLKDALNRDDIKPHFDCGKHLYWKSLNKQGQRKAERLGLRSIDWKNDDRTND